MEAYSDDVGDRVASTPVIYFLINQEEIIYIGSSLNLPVRIGLHRQNKRFDKVRYIVAASRDDMLDLEKLFIYQFKPRLNKGWKDTAWTPYALRPDSAPGRRRRKDWMKVDPEHQQ